MKIQSLPKSGWLLLLCLLACRPEDKELIPAEPDQPVYAPGQPTPPGKAVGEPTTKNIGPEGGTITTADGKLSLVFPAGALKASTPITIQPVENQVPAPFGDLAFEFMPKGLKPLKPVEVVRHYLPEEMNGTVPEAVGIAIQKADNVWHGRVNLTVDKNKRTLTTSFPGFDHPMSYYEQILMSPYKAVLLPRQEQEIKIIYTDRRGAKDEDLVPVPMPVVLKRHEVRNWKVNGESQQGGGKPANPVSGHFVFSDEGGWGTYYAPAAVPPGAYNPVAVSVELNLKSKGMIMLVGNYNIVSPGKMTIAGKQYENVDVVASYSKQTNYFSVSLKERHKPDAKSWASLYASVSTIFNGKGSYQAADNGTGDSYTKVNATDGKDTWAHAYNHTPGGRIWGPATVKIKEVTEKSIHGTIEATLHNNDPKQHKTIAVSGEFTVPIPPQ
jgi:hypothetical protein